MRDDETLREHFESHLAEMEAQGNEPCKRFATFQHLSLDELLGAWFIKYHDHVALMEIKGYTLLGEYMSFRMLDMMDKEIAARIKGIELTDDDLAEFAETIERTGDASSGCSTDSLGSSLKEKCAACDKKGCLGKLLVGIVEDIETKIVHISSLDELPDDIKMKLPKEIIEQLGGKKPTMH